MVSRSGSGEHVAHGGLLLLADAVLAGDGAAVIDAEVEDAVGKIHGDLLLAGNGLVVEDHGVEVAVASVEDVGAAEVDLGGHAGDGFKDAGKCGAGDDAILHDVVGRDAAHGGEGGFAALPDEAAFFGSEGEANLPGTVLFADGVGLGDLRSDLGGGAVEFDEQEGFADGVVGVDGGLGGLGGEAVHHLEGGGQHAGGDDVRDGLGRGGRGVKGGEQDLDGLRGAW